MRCSTSCGSGGRPARPSASAPWSPPGGRPRGPPVRRCWSGPDGSAVGSVSGGCVEGAVYELGQSVVTTGAPVLERYGVSDDDAFAVGLTCGGILDVYVEKVNQQTFPELGEVADDIEAGRPGRAGHRDRAPGPRAGRPPGRRTPGRPDSPRRTAVPGPIHDWNVSDYPVAGQRPGGRGGLRRCARPAGRRAQRDPDLRPRRRAARRGDARLRLGVRPGAADAGLRRHRLRGGGREGRRVPRLPRHRLRRAARVRDQQPVPRRRRGGGQVAAQVPRGGDRGRPDRRPHGHLRAHPRPEVRRTRPRAGAPAARGRLRRRDGLAPHPRRPARPAA